MKKIRRFSAVLLAVSALAGLMHAEPTVLRVGYFPNVTHAQGLVGSHSTRQGHGWFEQRLGPDVVIQWYPFNAGPSAMEAIFAGSLDLTYVGPNPALNAHFRSRGEEIRLLAGAAEGGAALVVRRDSGLSRPEDFRGHRIATPQLGNTQDVAARAWLRAHGYQVTLTGGDVLVVPTANPDQLALFLQGRLDAVWTVEPWVSRLELEAGGVVLVDQRDAVTTVLASSAAFLAKHPELAARFVAAHRELTAWLADNPGPAREAVRAALGAEMRREVPAEQVARAWSRLRFTDRLTKKQFEALVAEAQSVGFLRAALPLERLLPPSP